MDINVVDYKKKYKKEVLVGYYRGFPLSYYPYYGESEFVFRGCFLEDYGVFTKTIYYRDITKGRVTEIINLYKTWVDNSINEKAKEDETAKMLKDIFNEVVGDNDVVEENPIPKINVIQ
jgi:hypothetical protein